MTTQEKYNLRWQSFHSHGEDFLKDLFSSTHFTDVTLVSEDMQRVKAHKNVLSVCSPVFKELLLLDEMNNQSIIFLKGVKYQELEAILQFIYLGQATFHEERVSHFLEAASILEIKDLSKIHSEQKNFSSSIIHPKPTDLESSYEVKYQTMDFFGNQPANHQIQTVVESYEPLQCDYCELKYQTKSGLTSHLKAVHDILQSSNPSVEIHKCDQCEFQTHSTQSLRRHVMAKHEKIKHSCHQCNNEYSYPGDLKRHILSAHEGKRFACDLCGHLTTQIGDMARHKRNKHMM